MKKEILEKINNDIFERSMKHNFKELPRMGDSAHEFEYRRCRSNIDGLQNYYFIVSKKLQYKNSSLTNYKYNVYAYDKNGNYIEDAQVYAQCRGAFFKNLVDIK